MTNPNIQKIDQIVKSKPVALFMKGDLDFPACGFSAKVVSLLQAAGVSKNDIAHFDVLSDDGIRSAIKEYSRWPTLPQVFVKGKFIGGCDIVTEMFESGELQTLLKQ